jgi:metallophosphoesterase (TIGR00282 family)
MTNQNVTAPVGKKKVTILFVGDLVGRPGRALFGKLGASLRAEHNADCIIVNGENAAQNGRGITTKIAEFLFASGADVVTTGNHVWAQRRTAEVFNTYEHVVRPINFPADCPGKGYTIVSVAGVKVAVVNVQGRTYMHEQLSCPFKNMDSVLTYLKQETKVIFVDMHAEATSEKIGMGLHLDGKVSALVGTHTHVPTADERVLPKGTAFLSDSGCCAALNSMLGMHPSSVLHRMITQMPAKFEVDERGPFVLRGAKVVIDVATGKADSIERFTAVEDELDLSPKGAGFDK